MNGSRTRVVAMATFRLSSLLLHPGLVTGGNAAMLGVDVADKERALVTVNPNTGLPLGRYLFGDAYTGIITTFHARFLAPDPGCHTAQNTCMGWRRCDRVISLRLRLWWPRNPQLARGVYSQARRTRRNDCSIFITCSPSVLSALLVVVTGVYLAGHELDQSDGFAGVDCPEAGSCRARASVPSRVLARSRPPAAVALARASRSIQQASS